MKISFILFILLSISVLSVAQWEERKNGLPNSFSGSIDAVDENKAFIVWGKLIYRTTNAGMFWDSLDAVSEGSIIEDISSPSLNQVWVCTSQNDSIPASIFRSTDSGLTWDLQYSDASKTNFFNYIEMFDDLNGIAMGDALSATDPALFLKTTDGGENWISMNDQLIGMVSGQIWARLDFTDINTGYFYNSNYIPGIPQKIYKTTDGGANWNQLQWNGYITVLKFFNENIGIGVSNNTSSYLTNNAGVSWSYLGCAEGWGSDIEFLKNDASKVWMCKGDKLYGSLDTGKTWNEYPMGENFHGQDIVFVDNNHGWLISSSSGITEQYSTVYYTNNGGSIIPNSIKGNEENLLREFSLNQNYPNPFNPITNIEFQIAERGVISLKVFDVLGKEVATLVNEEKPAGNYEIEFEASSLSSGIYFYELRTEKYSSVKKMILLR